MVMSWSKFPVTELILQVIFHLKKKTDIDLAQGTVIHLAYIIVLVVIAYK